MAIRYYQREAVDAVFDFWRQEPGHPLVDMATGTGKSYTMATLINELHAGWPDMKIVSVTHVVELVEGNYKELLGVNPFISAGTYAASMGTRDSFSSVVFAQLQTVWNKASALGHVDVLIIDEVHLVPRKSNTMYRKFIDALLLINPDMKIVGFTATVYRFDSGRLDEGDDKLFDKVVYEYGIRRGIDDGYLTPVTSKPVGTKLDISGVGRIGGDFNKGALAAAVDKEAINAAIVEEVMRVEGHRRCALFFCAGVQHAEHFRDLVKSYGRSCEVVTGETHKTERRNIINALKTGKLWAACNDNVLSTGTNIPPVDLIVDVAPTASAGRYVQRVGRETRVVWPVGFDPDAHEAEERRAAIASGPKPNGRYMDFAGNINRHGPIDQIEPKKPGKGTGEAPIRLCPECFEICHAAARACSCCGFEFPESENVKVTPRASERPILAETAASTKLVKGRTFSHHTSKDPSKPDTVKITFWAGMKSYNQWIGPGSQGFMKTKSDRFWRQHNGSMPFPKSVEDFLNRQGELLSTAEIEVKPDGKYWSVESWAAGSPEAANDNWTTELDDAIPF